MLKWPRTNWWRTALLLAAMWLVFECLISWAAFCDQQQYATGNNESHKEYDCAFRGPIFLAARSFVGWWHHTFDDAEPYIALFTAVLAVCTLALWWATYGLQKTTAEQIRLAREEFLSTHRPLLRLKHMWLASQDGQSFDERLLPDTRIVVRLDIVNTGSTVAIVTLINFVTVLLHRDTRLPQRPPYNEPGIRQFPVRFSLPSGITFTTPVSDDRTLSESEIDGIEIGIEKLYFVGTIEYWDEGGKLRQTAFCRRLSFDRPDGLSVKVGRFEKIDDPDYEYQD
jgi:hypothetical protein